jgi:hypothetical protein
MFNGGFHLFCFSTIPFDTAKVRLQVQSQAAGQVPKYSGLFDCLSQMVKQEGIRAPWRGVVAGIQRQCAFAPIRIGLYEPVRNFYLGKDFKGRIDNTKNDKNTNNDEQNYMQKIIETTYSKQKSLLLILLFYFCFLR